MARKKSSLTAEKKILKARMQINQQKGGTPFFSYLLSQLQDEEAPWLPMPTAATDGEKIYWNREFIDGLSTREVSFVICHEIMHLVLQHFARRNHRERDKWGKAVDHELNLSLIEHTTHVTCINPPENLLADPKFADMIAEKIYTLIPDDDKSQTLDFHLDLSGQEDAEMRGNCKNKGIKIPVLKNPASPEMQSKWQNKLQEAAEHSEKHQGHVPGNCAEIINALRKPYVPWDRFLQEWCCTILSRDDYNWAHYNTMYIDEHDFYLPALRNETVGDIAVIVDTSGSMTSEQLSQMFAEFLNIRQMYDIENLHLIQCDHGVQKVDTYSQHDEIDASKIECHGRGGTSFTPAFEYIEEHQLNPEFICIMTDAYGDFPDKAPRCPSLAVLTENHADVPKWMDSVVLTI